jgi:hypothetical protein
MIVLLLVLVLLLIDCTQSLWPQLYGNAQNTGVIQSPIGLGKKIDSRAIDVNGTKLASRLIMSSRGILYGSSGNLYVSEIYICFFQFIL